MMNKNSFREVMKGFNWQQAQSKDMKEIDDDRHDSDAEEFRQESLRMQTNDSLEEYKKRGLDPSDFWSE